MRRKQVMTFAHHWTFRSKEITKFAHHNHVRCLISRKYVIMLIGVPSKTTPFSCRVSKKKTTQQLGNSTGFGWNPHPPTWTSAAPQPPGKSKKKHKSWTTASCLDDLYRQEESATNHCHVRRFYGAFGFFGGVGWFGSRWKVRPGGLFDLCPYLNSVCFTDSVSSSR